jgi:hypothetical protein
MEEDILAKIIRRTRESSGISSGKIPSVGINAMEPISVDAMEPISVDAMEPISVDAMEPTPVEPENLKPGRVKWDAMEPISVDAMEPISVDKAPPRHRPRAMEPISVDAMEPISVDRVIIGPITIYANSEGDGQAAARGFKEEMARRGVQFSR